MPQAAALGPLAFSPVVLKARATMRRSILLLLLSPAYHSFQSPSLRWPRAAAPGLARGPQRGPRPLRAELDANALMTQLNAAVAAEDFRAAAAIKKDSGQQQRIIGDFLERASEEDSGKVRRTLHELADHCTQGRHAHVEHSRFATREAKNTGTRKPKRSSDRAHAATTCERRFPHS